MTNDEPDDESRLADALAFVALSVEAREDVERGHVTSPAIAAVWDYTRQHPDPAALAFTLGYLIADAMNPDRQGLGFLGSLRKMRRLVALMRE